MLKNIGKNKILIQRMEEENELSKQLKSHGLVVPENMAVKIKSNKAKVLLVGKGDELDAMDVKVDDIVLLSQYSGIPVAFDEQNYLIVGVEEVLGVLE